MPRSPLWTFHGRMLPEESLDSWLLRLAHCNALDLGDFINGSSLFDRKSTRLALTLPLTFEVRDPQHVRQVTDVLSTHTLAAVDEIAKSMLRKVNTFNLLGQSRLRTGLNAFIELKKEHHSNNKALKRRYATQFCPACLREDKTPYLRREWLLNFVTVCPIHKTLLHDRCTECDQPLRPETSGWRLQPYQCDVCLTDIRTTSGTHVDECVELLSLQTQLVAEVEALLSEETIGLPLYSIVLERIEAKYFDESFLAKIKKAVTQEFGLVHESSVSFTRANVQERFTVLRLLIERTLLGH